MPGKGVLVRTSSKHSDFSTGSVFFAILSSMLCGRNTPPEPRHVMAITSFSNVNNYYFVNRCRCVVPIWPNGILAPCHRHCVPPTDSHSRRQVPMSHYFEVGHRAGIPEYLMNPTPRTIAALVGRLDLRRLQS